MQKSFKYLKIRLVAEHELHEPVEANQFFIVGHKLQNLAAKIRKM